METDGRHDYLICKELLVGFVVTGLDCLEAREWVVYFLGVCMCVLKEALGVGGYCLCVFVHLLMCLSASHMSVFVYSQNNNDKIVLRSRC